MDSNIVVKVLNIKTGIKYYFVGLLAMVFFNMALSMILKDISANKILIGWSAAAFVFGPTLELVNCYSPEMNFLGLTDLSGLSLTDVQVLPHYSKFLSKFEKFEEKCCIYEERNGVKVIRINDGDGVFVDKEIIICKNSFFYRIYTIFMQRWYRGNEQRHFEKRKIRKSKNGKKFSELFDYGGVSGDDSSDDFTNIKQQETIS